MSSDVFERVVQRLALTCFHLSDAFRNCIMILLPSQGIHRLLMHAPLDNEVGPVVVRVHDFQRTIVV